MYLQHFQFSSEPFSIAPDPRFLFLSVRHEEALAHLLYGLREGGGFVALTGEVGTGKTTLCHCLMEQLPETVDLALVLNPKLSSLELIATLCDELGLDYPDNNTSIKVVTDALNEYLLSAHEHGRRTVVLIDEAQNLSHDVLEQIRLLTNLETQKTKLLQIILVGQPELNDLLNCKELRQLSQRITGRYHLIPLDYKETKGYIRHRLAKVDGRADVFSAGALRMLFRRSKGIPRLINTIADRALLGAYSKNQLQVSAGLVNNAANEILNSGKQTLWRAVLAGLVLGATIVALGWFIWNQKHNSQVQVQQTATPIEKVVIDSLADTGEPTELKPTELKPTELKPAELKPAELQASPPQLLSDVIQVNSLTLPEAFSRLFRVFGLNDVGENTLNPCDLAKQQGYACLIDRGHWRQILQFDRPVILELENSNTQKFHVVLKAVTGNQVFLNLGNQQDFTTELNQLASLWNGNYVQLWKIPGRGKYILREGDVGDNVLRLRERLTVVDMDSLEAITPSVFDNTLTERVSRFQTKNGLDADGVVGPKTWMLLNNTLNAERPRLIHKDD